jgi:hypothetical protein
MPLKGNEIANKTPYVAAYNEIFIGFGKNKMKILTKIEWVTIGL